jgi:hypothetical protein
MSEVNKVIFAGAVLLDLTGDTVTEDVIIDGYTGHDAAGNKITGKLKIITVDDALDSSSTNPVQNKVVASALNAKADKSAGVFYIEGTGDTAGTWLGSHSGITEYYPGLMIAYKPSVAGASGLTLNINNLGAVSVIRNVNSAVTTHYGVESVVFLVYTIDDDGTAYWKVADYDSDTKTRSSNLTAKKMYIIGAQSQSTSGQTTYSNSNCYIGTDNCLYSGGKKVSTSDTNTTYSLSKSGSTITLTGSDGSTTSVTDSDTNTVYTHPSYTAKSSGFYKVTVDATGHVSGATAVTKADITALGIPAQDTTYSLSSFGITATAAELNYTDGVTSNIQTQLNGKLSTSGTAAKATADASGNTITSTYATKTELTNGLATKANAATSLSGYGITNAYTKTETQNNFVQGVATADVDKVYDGKVYMVKSGSNCPSGSQYGVVLGLPYRQLAGNTIPDFGAQIFIPNGDDVTKPNSMFFRTSLASSWNAWQEIATTDAATTSKAGLMSASDKSKLDGIASGANNYTYTLPAATSSALGGVKVGTNISVSSGTISVANGSTSAKGVVQLSSATNSTSTSLAATASAVKAAYDLANGKQSPATTLNGYGITDAVPAADVGNAANKIPRYNSDGHLVLPDGSEFWIG